MKDTLSSDSFLKGLVFGFDVGAGSIGYAVRRGSKFLDVGVLICPEGTNDLSGRRGLRRQRRTLDHRQSRRDWFAENLAKVLGLALHKGTRLPQSAWTQNEKGGWIPTSSKLMFPASLRVDALAGEELTAEELFTALVHLIKHRGPAERVPWSKTLAQEKREKDQKENESASGTIPADQVRAEFEHACIAFVSQNPNAPVFHPAHYLQQLDDAKKPQRKRAWPRDLVEAEAAAILERQSRHHKKLKEGIEFTDLSGKQRKTTVAEWLLYGNSSIKTMREGETVSRFHVFDRNHVNRERAPFTFQAARIHNRKPGLDLVEPRDEFGRPRYVMSRERTKYRRWQVEIALLNFKVLDLTSFKKKKPLTVPSPHALAELREIIARTEKLSLEDLQNWVKPYKEKGIYDLAEKQTDLVGEGKGRGRFSNFGLHKATEIIRPLQAEHDAMSKLTPKGQRAKKKLKTPEAKAEAYVRRYVNYTPKLRYDWENPATQTIEHEPLPRALRRYIQEIRDPVVRHRVELFDRTLDDLLEKHCSEGNPAHIIVECVRQLEQDADAAQEAWEKRKKDREQNQVARATLRDMGIREPTEKDIRKFRLLQECKWRCPYTLERFMQAEFDDLVINRIVPPVGDPRRASYLKAAHSALKGTEVEHMIPQAATVCDEWFNVTVTRSTTNNDKGNRIPYEFVLRDADEVKRGQLLDNATECFGADSLKFKIFSSPDARSLIQERDKLQRTAYIARCLRYVCLLKCGWLSPEDRDPGHEKANDASRHYLVTNGGLTRRLRQAWKLDELLREALSTECWASMGDVDKERALSQGASIPSEEWKKLDKAKQADVLRARRTKNRQDVRHHALDAMVVACTLPWAANLTSWASGWCNLDPEDGSVSSIRCPVFGEDDYGQAMHAAADTKLTELKSALPDANSNTIKHYRSNERHKQVFDSQLYGKRTAYGGKVLDEAVFVVAKKLSDLTPAVLVYPSKGDAIFSEEIRKQISIAWKAYTADEANWRRLLERSRSELETEALDPTAKPKTKEAIKRRLRIVEQWAKETPNEERWAKLQEFLQQEKARRAGHPAQRKAVFPDDFITTLYHWRYRTPIRSVQVIAQAKEEDNYAELRPGSNTFWKYTGRYAEMRVYDAPLKARKGTRFICWLVRPYYPAKRNQDGKLLTSAAVRAASMPPQCQGQKLRAVFHNGQVVRLTKAVTGMDITHNWLVCETNVASSKTNALIMLVPGHLARIVKDPDDPKKTIDLKKQQGALLPLNEFMLGLGYEPAAKNNELPHPPSVKPQSEGPHQA
jgi:hypothetical protein